MTTETQLWQWLLSSGALAPQRAKALLEQWQARGLTLSQALARLPAQAPALGVSAEEARRLCPPAHLPEARAIRWDEASYPAGLRALPLRLRPALLYYRGDADLLHRPIVLLPSSALTAATRDMSIAAISLLLEEPVLLAAHQDSPQAELLLSELHSSQGEALLLLRAGLDRATLSEDMMEMVAAGRLLALTPLPPGAAADPALDPILAQLGWAAARWAILSDVGALPADPIPALPPTLLLGSAASLPPGVTAAEDPAEILLWLDSLASPAPPPAAWETDVDDFSLGPPPTPDEVLRTLEKGGTVPEVLRRRLQGP